MRFNPEIMKNILNFIESAYHLRSNNVLESNFKLVRYGTEAVSHMDTKIWKLLPEECREIDYLSIFNRKISN